MIDVTIYRGHDGHLVDKIYSDGRVEPLTHYRSLELADHSPTGFSWGYNGSGPSQLSLALLLDVTDSDAVAMEHYHVFKREVVSLLPVDGTWSLSSKEVLDWLAGH